jgi:hypothetical protein
MGKWTKILFELPSRHHMWMSLGIVIVATMVISAQVADRQGFANGELYQDVMNRWGTRIDQPAPSVRYVESGTVFTTLKPLELSRQQIKVDAQMNYRKRGLVYFSGFDFDFTGTYEVANPEDRDVDIVFVFPVSLDRNKVLLSELDFTVNGEPSEVELSQKGDKIVWTGRLKKLQKARFDVGFKGRGLDSFTYRLDPALPAKNFSLAMNITGGDNYDYPSGVVPAHLVEQSDDVVRLFWEYPSLESGVNVGTILPSEKSFDQVIATMARRSWAPFLAFFIALVALMASLKRTIKFYEAYLIAAGYGFFFVLLAYLAAVMNFYVAYFITSAIIIGLLVSYSSRLLSGKGMPGITALLIAFLTVPSAAVIAQGYTGLIYSLEILGGLAALMFISTHPKFAALLETLIPQEEVSHEA